MDHAQNLDPGVYLMAGLCEEDDVVELRKPMEGLRIGEPRVHWHGSQHERRVTLVLAVAEFPVASLVVVHIEAGANNRRHRRKCMDFPAAASRAHA